MQLYAGKGADGGVDADYDGSFAGVAGRWVFQYKFIHPSTDPRRARESLKRKMLTPSGKPAKDGGEFAKPGVQGACGYVLLTNVEVTVPLFKKLRQAFAILHPEAKLCVWDPATLNAMLRTHPHLARSRSQSMEMLSLKQVIHPLWSWVVEAEGIVDSWNRQEHPIWPLQFTTEAERVEAEGYFDSPAPRYMGRLDNSAPLPHADHRVERYARQVAFPQSLTSLEFLINALTYLSKAISAYVYDLAGKLQEPSGPLGAFTAEERDRMSLGLACMLIEDAWGSAARRPTFKLTTMSVYGYTIYQGDRDELLKAFLAQQGKKLRAHYQRGHKLPADVLKARELVSDAVHALADALWYPMNLAMDAPGEHLPDQAESD